MFERVWWSLCFLTGPLVFSNEEEIGYSVIFILFLVFLVSTFQSFHSLAFVLTNTQALNSS